MWNGRFVAHTLVQIFMQLDKFYFNILNSLAFLALGILINLIVSKFNKSKLSAFNLTITFILLWFFIPEFGNTVLWVSGSGNYLWMALIYCAFIYLFVSNLENKTSIKFLLIGIPLGFLTGATNENSGAAVIGICLLFFIRNSLIKKNINIPQLFSIIVGFIGSLVLIKSPGATQRSSVILNIEHLIASFIKLQKMYYTHLGILLLILLVAFLIAMFCNKLKRSDLFFIGAFLLGSFASLNALAFSNEFPLRTLFGPSIFVIIPTIYLINLISEFYNTYTLCIPVKKVVVIIALSIFIFSYIKNAKSVLQTYNVVIAGVEIVEKSKEQGIVDDIVIPKPIITSSSYDSFTHTSSLLNHPNEWFNQWMAKYYGVNSIIGKD